VCGWCPVSKGYLNTQWNRPAEVYREWRTEAVPVLCIPGLSALHVRYCAMHGCNRMLDNSLQLIARMGCTQAVKRLVRLACTKWEQAGSKGRLQCYEMKLFYAKQLHVAIPLLFAGLPPRMVFTSADKGEAWTQEELVHRLLAACHTYFTYSYNHNPSGAALMSLEHAQRDFLAATSSFRGRFPPTSHYMTTHFLDFIRCDRGAYVTVQEGPEHHHKLDRGVALRTWTNPRGSHMPFTRMEQVLRTYELRRILLERGHEPNL
jgi:hypothetical protein